MDTENKKLLPGQRCDGFDDKGCPIGNEIREKWIHKKIPKQIGDTEDDYVLIEKAVKIETANIQKEIEQQAAGCPSIRQLIADFNETGDESVFNKHELTYGDASDMPTDLHEAIKIVNDAKEKGMNLGDDKILSMSKSDIEKLIDAAVKKMVDNSKSKDQPKQQDDAGGNE